MVGIVALPDGWMEAASAQSAVAVIDSDIVENRFTIAPAVLHEDFHAFEELREAIRQEAVVVVKRRGPCRRL